VFSIHLIYCHCVTAGYVAGTRLTGTAKVFRLVHAEDVILGLITAPQVQSALDE
jgi:hypothetical protein